MKTDVLPDSVCEGPTPDPDHHCWCRVYAGGTRLQCCRCENWRDGEVEVK